MKITLYRVNATGLREIHAFLASHHRLGGAHFSPDMLRAWAADAEFQLGEGNPACIEVPARDSVSGATVEYRISPEGLDTETLEIDD